MTHAQICLNYMTEMQDDPMYSRDREFNFWVKGLIDKAKKLEEIKNCLYRDKREVGTMECSYRFEYLILKWFSFDFILFDIIV